MYTLNGDCFVAILPVNMNTIMWWCMSTKKNPLTLLTS